MDYLQHYGVKGQRWGVRRYQNEDGTLTDEGKLHYSAGDSKKDKKKKDLVNKAIDSAEIDRQHWNAVAESNKRYYDKIKKSNPYLKDKSYSKEDAEYLYKEDLSYSKAAIDSARQHAKSWEKTRDSLLKMPINELSVREVKKQTKRGYLVNKQVNRDY